MKSLGVKKICALLTFLLFASGCSQNNLFALEVGQCFTNSGIGEEVSNVDLVDCDEPHLNEIYALPELPDGDFPLVFIAEDSAKLCYNAFESFVSQAYEYSIYEVGFIHPSKETWDEYDDREVVCYLYETTGQLKTGTAANSGL